MNVYLDEFEKYGNHVRLEKRNGDSQWLKYNGRGWVKPCYPNGYVWYSFLDFKRLIEVRNKPYNLMEYDTFKLTKSIPRGFHPGSKIDFYIEHNEFPFLIEVSSNYMITIPFSYKSSDDRVGIATGNFVCHCKVLDRVNTDSNMSIEWVDSKPVLTVDNLTKCCKIRSMI